MDAVHAALRAGRPVPRASLRTLYQGQLSHGTFYRFVTKAIEAFRVPETANPA